MDSIWYERVKTNSKTINSLIDCDWTNLYWKGLLSSCYTNVFATDFSPTKLYRLLIEFQIYVYFKWALSRKTMHVGCVKKLFLYENKP